jgi:hypothetical protein
MHQEVGATAEELDHVADNRQSRVTHHGFEVTARRRIGERFSLELRGQQLALDGTEPGEVVDRRGEPAPRLIQQVVLRADGRHSPLLTLNWLWSISRGIPSCRAHLTHVKF